MVAIGGFRRGTVLVGDLRELVLPGCRRWQFEDLGFGVHRSEKITQFWSVLLSFGPMPARCRSQFWRGRAVRATCLLTFRGWRRTRGREPGNSHCGKRRL